MHREESTIGPIFRLLSYSNCLNYLAPQHYRGFPLWKARLLPALSRLSAADSGRHEATNIEQPETPKD
jgi:hypothetical protein